MLRIKNLSVSIAGKKIIDSFSFEFKKDNCYVLMGPNGSGKSTLAMAVMGHLDYKITQGKIFFDKDKINSWPTDKRARKGIFLSFQIPLSLNGVNVFQLLKNALGQKKDPLVLKNQLEKDRRSLALKEELISRSLNEGSSGGERKKLEVLQMASLDPKLIIFDEVDTGVDIDALKTLAQFIKRKQKNKTYIIITHYNRILRYIKPDRVLVIDHGQLVKEGDYRLAEEIEKKGYKQIKY